MLKYLKFKKLHDGRGKRFKKLIDPKLIMKENRLKHNQVLPKHARPKRFVMWLQWVVAIAILFVLLNLAVDIVRLLLYDERPVYKGFVDFIYSALVFGAFFGGLGVLSAWSWTWRSQGVAIRTLSELGFCPNCGYFIRDTPSASDGCTPCSECGLAWRVEAAET